MVARDNPGMQIQAPPSAVVDGALPNTAAISHGALPSTVAAADGALPLTGPAAASTDAATRLGLIVASGADAARFLHGQLTQDIEHLPPGGARLAGYCSAKGRLLASFIVWRGHGDEVRLLCSADVLAPTLKRLSMFVLRAKVKLEDASALLRVDGLAGGSALSSLGDKLPNEPWQVATAGDGMQWLRLPDAAGVPRALRIAAADAPPPALPALPADAWQWLEVASGIPRIVAAIADQFVPQMINFEQVGGVNFHKGCYPGQEVVARSQYRGTIKRRAQLFECAATAVPGQDLYAEGDDAQPAGMVVNAASLDGRHLLLAEVRLAAAGNALQLGAAGGPRLAPQPLPYPIVDGD